MESNMSEMFTTLCVWRAKTEMKKKKTNTHIEIAFFVRMAILLLWMVVVMLVLDNL